MGLVSAMGQINFMSHDLRWGTAIMRGMLVQITKGQQGEIRWFPNLPFISCRSQEVCGRF